MVVGWVIIKRSEYQLIDHTGGSHAVSLINALVLRLCNMLLFPVGSSSGEVQPHLCLWDFRGIV